MPLACSGLLTGATLACGASTAIDTLSQSIEDSVAARWTGPRVPRPAPAARPSSVGRLRSHRHPVQVHVSETASVGPATAERVLRALEWAHDWLHRSDWPLPYPDGGGGGTPGFDLYLTGAAERPAGARGWAAGLPDRPVWSSRLDAWSAFGWMLDRVPDDSVEACAVVAYLEAALHGQDPAEALAWRRATAGFGAQLVVGQLGCTPEVRVQQEHPERAWISQRGGAGGALFLSLLSADQDGGTGTFIRDLWSGARQQTWEGDALRASPDLFEVLAAALAPRERTLQDVLTAVGVGRIFLLPPRLKPLSAASPAPNRVSGRADWSRLPARVRHRRPALEAGGSAYVVVDTRRAPAGETLRTWLRGEIGVSWSMTALRFDAEGRELGRLAAPPTDEASGRAYLPVELLDGAAAVWVVVTNLGRRRLDADEHDDQVRAFQLLFDRASAP